MNIKHKNLIKITLSLIFGFWVAGVIAFLAYVAIVLPTSSRSLVIEKPLDNRELIVEVISPIRTVYNPFTEVTVLSNKQIELDQNNRVEWRKIGAQNGKHYYLARIVNLPIDETNVKLTMRDFVGNTVEKELSLTRERFSMPAGFTEISGWENAEYILDAKTYAGPVTKSLRLLEDYTPTDIVNLNEEFGIFTFNNAELELKAARSLSIMLNDLRAETGKSVTVASGYRSYNTQLQTYAGIVKRQGQERANQISAKPGHSEHQLGTAIDITNDEVNWELTADIANTTAGKWLIANCKKYGFVQFLDESQVDYQPEPWQFRYIGLEELN